LSAPISSSSLISESPGTDDIANYLETSFIGQSPKEASAAKN
jgi:hypothetical protein